jgi:hypothetical protein
MGATAVVAGPFGSLPVVIKTHWSPTDITRDSGPKEDDTEKALSAPVGMERIWNFRFRWGRWFLTKTPGSYSVIFEKKERKSWLPMEGVEEEEMRASPHPQTRRLAGTKTAHRVGSGGFGSN